jgi:hypothetical protein
VLSIIQGDRFRNPVQLQRKTDYFRCCELAMLSILLRFIIEELSKVKDGLHSAHFTIYQYDLDPVWMGWAVG